MTMTAAPAKTPLAGTLQPLASTIKRAAHWWLGELRSLLPGALLKNQTGKEHAVLITPDGWQSCGTDQTQRPKNGAVAVYVSQDLAIHHVVTLPAAARRTLRTVVGYEMDRITPFTVDDVYFSCAATAKDADSLRVDVHVVPKTYIDPSLKDLRDKGFQLKRVDIAKQNPAEKTSLEVAPKGLGLNLLIESGEGQKTSLPRALRWSAALLLAAVLFAGWSIFHQQAALIDAYEARLFRLRDKLNSQTSPQGKQRGEAVRYAADIVPFTVLMDDITARLADDTYIFALRIDGERLTLSGASRQAAELLTALDASPFISEPAFSAPIVQDPVTGRERFSLSCKITREQVS